MVNREIIKGDALDAAEIEKQLLKSLATTNVQSVNKTLVFKRLDETGSLIAGVTGSTSYGWLLVKNLWVDERYRGQGIACVLMKKVEETAAVEFGCHQAWLDTSNENAKAFYENRGYEIFGILDNNKGQKPLNHKRWFLKKPLH